MENKEYLTEERYQKTNKKIIIISLMILLIGLSIGGFLVYNGIAKPNSSKVDSLQKVLEEKKKNLEDKGIVYDDFAKYTDGEAYDLKIITDALDPSFSHCEFDEYKNNSNTKEYCAAKNSISDFNCTSSIMFGTFIIIASCMFSGVLYMNTKNREMAAYRAQQMMPIAQEGMEKMAPTIGKVGKEIAEDMAPVYADIAKEISNGIKEGLQDEDNN